MKIARCAHNFLRFIPDGFFFNAPAPCGFKGGFDRFDTSIHRECLLIPRVDAEFLQKGAHHVVVESPRSEGDAGKLGLRRFDDVGVKVALIHRRVRRKKIVIFAPFWVPDFASSGLRDDNRYGVIIVCAVKVVQGDVVLGIHAILLCRIRASI